MIRFIDTSKSYKLKSGRSIVALDGVNLDLADSGLTFVCGENGSGKTTLLNLLGGMDSVSDGDIIVDGYSLKSLTKSQCDGYRNTYIGYIYQTYNLIDGYTVGENIAIALEIRHKKVGREEIDEVLKTVGLVDKQGETFYNREISELSGGQLQRVAIARALVKGAEILLADEPTGALDVSAGDEILELLKNLSKKMPVIVVSHNASNIKQYADRIITLQDGKVIDDTAPLKIDAESNAAVEKTKKLEKSGIPFARSVILAFKGLKYHKIRLAVSVFLCIVMCSAFVFAFTSRFADKNTPQIRACYNDDKQMIRLASVAYLEYTAHGQKVRTPCGEKDIAQIKTIENYTGGKIMYELYHGNLPFRLEENLASSLPDEEWGNRYLRKACYDFESVAEIDSETGLSDACLSPDARFVDSSKCRLPQTFDEIAITDLKFDAFKKLGYKDAEGNVYKIKTPDDLIGKKLGAFAICGVFSTETDLEKFKEDYDYFTNIEDEITYKRLSGMNIINYAFLKKGYIENEWKKYCEETGVDDEFSLNQIKAVLVKLSGDLHKDKALLKDLKYIRKGDTNPNYTFYMEMAVESNYYGFVKAADFLWEPLFLKIVLIAAIILAVISLLMLTVFFNIGFEARKQEMGVLTALGASGGDIAKINLTESLIISSFIFVFTLIVSAIMNAVINSRIGIPLFATGGIHILVSIGICYLIPLLATSFFILCLRRKSPNAVIKRK